MTSVSQNELERCSERTKSGMVGAIKSKHIPNRFLLGFKRIDGRIFDVKTLNDLPKYYNKLPY